MKRLLALILALIFSLSLSACAANQSGTTPTPSENKGPQSDSGTVTKRFRIITSDNGAMPLLLAEQDGGAVLSLRYEDCTKVTFEGMTDEELAASDIAFLPGVLAEITWDGSILATYPSRFSGNVSVKILKDGFDDWSRLCLDVLEDLWTNDEGLSEDIEELGVDLSKSGLSESEQTAVAMAFGSAHGFTPICATWEELADRGYIDREKLSWDMGCLFSIEAKEGSDESAMVFDASKWRSGLGAYFFTDCTAERDADGHWGEYTIGAEAIA